MKREPDLVRQILLEIEAKASANGARGRDLTDFVDDPRIAYHVQIMQEAGLVTGKMKSAMGHSSPPDATGLKLTFEGHEMADQLRPAEAWRAASGVMRRFGSISFGTLSSALQKYGTKVLLRAGGDAG